MPLLLLALLQSLLLTLGQVLLKFALLRMEAFGWTAAFWRSVLLNWQFALCGGCFAAASVLWMYIIKHFPLSMAYPMVSISYVFGMIAAIVFFHESVDWIKWLGVFLIMAGCVLIAR
jgi:drug/metabolite transporter (DMT)-like permease